MKDNPVLYYQVKDATTCGDPDTIELVNKDVLLVPEARSYLFLSACTIVEAMRSGENIPVLLRSMG